MDLGKKLACRQGFERQSFQNIKEADCEALMVHLLSKTGTIKASWTSSLVPSWETGKDGIDWVGKQKVYLKCPTCSMCWLATYPTLTATRHSASNCGKEVSVTPEYEVIDVESVDLLSPISSQSIAASTSKTITGVKRTSSDSVQARIDQYQVPASVKDKVMKDLAMFFFTTDTSMRRMEDNHLVRAFKHLNIKLPCEKTLRTTWLDRCHAEVQAKNNEDLSLLLVSLKTAGILHSAATT
jgi:hypothetical protein